MEILKIGVTGHRLLNNTAVLTKQIQNTLHRIRQHFQQKLGEMIAFEIVSSLAEGADRLVVHETLKELNASLIVPLPFPKEDYMSDFVSSESRKEFEGLLKRAKKVETIPPARTRNEGYERAGQYVINQSDVLIALWDGEYSGRQGGTSDMVKLAKVHHIPLFWIHTKEPYNITEEL
ncbi:MAG: hypothetical protein B6D35_06045 [Candidatus Brocadia sp. UTAMX2]|jgi:uncharacterized phage-like protein YoqJ|nr:MAG: hypothetical protein B6D35_06045 [Candidatus Brocadia sp. UTAMX2]